MRACLTWKTRSHRPGTNSNGRAYLDAGHPHAVRDEPADQHHADIRSALERAGTPIGNHDLFIAAHARSRGLTLVTHNTREFEQVSGLRVEDWLVPPA